MSLRLPRRLDEGKDESSIEAAIVAEKAVSLGQAGRRLELALAGLRDPQPGRARAELIDEAAERAWAYLTQRELCGLRDNRQAIADFAIPAEVMARVGAGRPRGAQ